MGKALEETEDRAECWAVQEAEPEDRAQVPVGRAEPVGRAALEDRAARVALECWVVAQAAGSRMALRAE